jgi:carbamate kinase
VIDKDHACSLLASELGAELLLISTSVEKVALDFATPEQRWVDHLSLEEARRYLNEGVHFAKGSMEPKIEAIVAFLERGGTRAIVTNPENVEGALAGLTGTHFTRD